MNKQGRICSRQNTTLEYKMGLARRSKSDDPFSLTSKRKAVLIGEAELFRTGGVKTGVEYPQSEDVETLGDGRKEGVVIE